MNITAADSIVSEYLIYRGFTATYASLQNEKLKDRVKKFEVASIVEAIFHYIQSFQILNFVSLWDFMTKRFFAHLDMDHVQVSLDLKADLLKYYLVNAFKVQEKSKITDFFSLYSHEILSESGISKHLRSWYILPYIENPDNDKEFSPYFQSRWIESLKLTVSNFLSIVLSTAPPPKLLLLERWFRSEAQQEIRQQLKQSLSRIDILTDKLLESEERLLVSREIIKELSSQLVKVTFDKDKDTPSTMFKVNEDDHGDSSKSIGQRVVKLSIDGYNKSKFIQGLAFDSKIREILGPETANAYFNETNNIAKVDDNSKDFEKNIHSQVQLWIESLSSI